MRWHIPVFCIGHPGLGTVADVPVQDPVWGSQNQCVRRASLCQAMTFYGQMKAGFGLRDIQESVLLRKILYGAVFV